MQKLFGKPATTTLENFIDKLKKEPDLPSSVQVVSCCVYNKPPQKYAWQYSELVFTFGPIWLFISFYLRSPCSMLFALFIALFLQQKYFCSHWGSNPG